MPFSFMQQLAPGLGLPQTVPSTVQTTTTTTTTTPPPAPAPAPDPVEVMTRAFNDANFADGFYNLMANTVGKMFENLTNSLFDLLRTAWTIPTFLFHREGITDEARVVQLNDMLIALLAGFVLLACVYVACSNILAIRNGNTPNAAALFGDFMVILVAAFVACSSLAVLSAPLWMADLIFDAIGTATLVDYASPGLVIVPTPIPAGGIILALVYFGVMAYTTVVAFLELTWCTVLLAESALWLFAWCLPFPVTKSIGAGLGHKFIGTVFSPALMLGAMRLAAPTLEDLAGGDLVSQMTRIFFAIVAYQTPGVLAGAISVHFPSTASAFAAGRAVGLFRAGPLGSGGGGGGGGGSATQQGAAAAVSAPRASSPGWAGSVSGKPRFPGGRVNDARSPA